MLGRAVIVHAPPRLPQKGPDQRGPGQCGGNITIALTIARFLDVSTVSCRRRPGTTATSVAEHGGQSVECLLVRHAPVTR